MVVGFVVLFVCLFVCFFTAEAATTRIVAFHAMGVHGDTIYTRDATINVTDVRYNSGNAYDKTTSTFVAPVTGLYLFHFTGRVSSSSPVTTNNHAVITVDDRRLVWGYASHVGGHYSSTSIQVVYTVRRGQRVHVINGHEGVMWTQPWFSGALLQAETA